MDAGAWTLRFAPGAPFARAETPRFDQRAQHAFEPLQDVPIGEDIQQFVERWTTEEAAEFDAAL